MLDTTKKQGTAPFDTARLDRLMDEQGFDILLITWVFQSAEMLAR